MDEFHFENLMDCTMHKMFAQCNYSNLSIIARCEVIPKRKGCYS